MMHMDPGKQSAYPCEPHEFHRGSSHEFPCHQRKSHLMLDQASAGSNEQWLTYRTLIRQLDQEFLPPQFQMKCHQLHEFVQQFA
jgi:hypothetical protein